MKLLKCIANAAFCLVLPIVSSYSFHTLPPTDLISNDNRWSFSRKYPLFLSSFLNKLSTKSRRATMKSNLMKKAVAMQENILRSSSGVTEKKQLTNQKTKMLKKAVVDPLNEGWVVTPDTEAENKQSVEHEQHEAARRILEKEKCVEEEISRLKDVADKIIAAQTLPTPTDDEKAKAEAEELGKLRAAADQVASHAAAEEGEALRAVESAPPTIDKIQQRTEEEELNLEAKGKKIDENEKKEECETKEELKTFMKAEMEPEVPSENPDKEKLELEKAEAKTLEELANVEVEQAESDLDKADALLEEVKTEEKKTESKDDEVKHELEGGTHPEETIPQALTTAHAVNDEIESEIKKLDEAKVLIADSREEAKKATEQSEEAMNDACEDEEHQQLAAEVEEKGQEAEQKAKDAQEKINSEQEKLEELKLKTNSVEMEAEHEAAALQKKEEASIPQEKCNEAIQPSPCCEGREAAGAETNNSMKEYKAASEKEDQEIESNSSQEHSSLISVKSGNTNKKDVNKENRQIKSSISGRMMSTLTHKGKKQSRIRNHGAEPPSKKAKY